MTYLFPNRLSRHQMRFNGDEQCDKCSLTQAPQSVITTNSAMAPLLTVAQQHCWCIQLECSINLLDGIKKKGQSVFTFLLARPQHLSINPQRQSLSPWTENKWCWKESWQSPASASLPECVLISLCLCHSEEQKVLDNEAMSKIICNSACSDTIIVRENNVLLTTPVS